jgi:hypothetical protein
MVMAEKRINYLWTTAIFKHWYLQLQLLVTANLDYDADVMLDLFRS